MSVRAVVGDVALSGSFGSGTHVSAPLANGPGIGDVILGVHVTAMTGTSPAVVVSVEQSVDGSTWTAVAGATTASITAVGNVTCIAGISQNFARVKAVVSGTTPNVTLRVMALVFAE